MRNPLQDQLLKAGLAKKSQATQAVREQAKQRQGKAAPPNDAQAQAERARLERVERDRALSAQRNAQARAQELAAQVRQIVQAHRIETRGEIEYRFADGAAIRSVLVDRTLRAQLASGAVLIVRDGASYSLVPRAAADKLRARDESVVVLDHAATPAAPAAGSDDAYYAQFKVPDDLVW